FLFNLPHSPVSPLFPYTTLFRSGGLPASRPGHLRFPCGFRHSTAARSVILLPVLSFRSKTVRQPKRLSGDLTDSGGQVYQNEGEDRKSTRLNSSHPVNSYAVFCL